jgi:uncharacterized phage-like protein YoqJ
MREQLKKELLRLIAEENFSVQHANDILILYDDETKDGHSECTAYDKAMQDIDNVKAGEWD